MLFDRRCDGLGEILKGFAGLNLDYAGIGLAVLGGYGHGKQNEQGETSG